MIYWRNEDDIYDAYLGSNVSFDWIDNIAYAHNEERDYYVKNAFGLMESALYVATWRQV